MGQKVYSDKKPSILKAIENLSVFSSGDLVVGLAGIK
jgi:hypothetical protein